MKMRGETFPMARPPRCRWVSQQPTASYFKPRGIPLSQLEEVTVTVDEFEALRLADLDGLYQEQAAERMKVSRPTFGRIIDSAHRKVAEALVKGKALRIEGGNFIMPNMRTFHCSDCGHTWQVSYGTGRPADCPACHGRNFHRTDEERGQGHGFRHKCRRGTSGSNRDSRQPVPPQA
jgi:predicted DNA-binding protein (UPF0251 family)